MKDIMDVILKAFPALAPHEVAVARVTLVLLVLGGFYVLAKPRRWIFTSIAKYLNERIDVTNRALFVSRGLSGRTSGWKHYTFETEGRPGDDIVWTLVKWPSCRPTSDSFIVRGGYGELNAFYTSKNLLYARWQVVFEPTECVGLLPARGLFSVLRRVGAPVCAWLARI